VDQTQQLLALVIAALVGLLAILLIVRRQRIERDEGPAQSPFAASTEGEKVCPKCGMGNLWTDDRCISCGADLPG
jgi:hypothetical protein